MYRVKDWKRLGKKHDTISEKCIQWIRSKKEEPILYCDLVEWFYSTFKNEKIKRAFPIGISKNNIGAHDTAMLGDTRSFHPKTDIVCIDFGIHEKGYIIDSAFTWNPRYIYEEPLQSLHSTCIDVSKEAVKKMTSLCRPDALLFDIAREVEEIVLSYDDIYGIPELTGHTIERWNIHGEKLIPSSTKISSFFENNPRINVHDVCALEVYITTSPTKVIMDAVEATNHFLFRKPATAFPQCFTERTKQIITSLQRYDSLRLPFSQHYVMEQPSKHWTYMVNECYGNNLLSLYPPVKVKKEHIIAQTEDTVYVSDNITHLLTTKQNYQH